MDVVLKLMDQLAWRGPNDLPLKYIVLTREEAEDLLMLLRRGDAKQNERQDNNTQEG